MILKGDCIEVMKAMKSNSVDAIVTDPPYGLEFMGKEWDKLWDKREFGIDEYSKKSYTCSDGSTRKTNPVSRKLSNPNYKAGIEAQLWHTQWLIEAYRVLKPGGSMLVMGGTRTSHRLACAIEDSGFIIKDKLMWIYGSGFPKAQELSTLVDAKTLGISMKEVKERREVVGKQKPFGRENRKKMMNGSPFNTSYENKDCEYNITKPLTPEGEYWNGFKVGGIKPAYEPIIWAVKPPEGSYIDNVLKWGVGAVNVDECRVGLNQYDKEDYIPNRCGHKDGINRVDKLADEHNSVVGSFGAKGFKKPHWNQRGRFPANIILSHHPECVQVGVKRVKGLGGSGRASDKGHGFQTEYVAGIKKGEGFNGGFVDKDGYEQVESWDCHPDCAVRLLDEQSGIKQSKWGKDAPNELIGNINYVGKERASQQQFRGDSGGASRFFYCAKASRAERNAGLEGMEEKTRAGINKMMGNEKGGESMKTGSGNIRNNKLTNFHPTIKPIKLFEYLIKLVTREGQIILDPFIGSGTTGIAAHNAGRKCMGIEKEEEYIEIAKRRATYWRSRPRQLEMTVG